MTSTTNNLTESEVVAQGRRVTWVGFGVNAVLAFLKIVAGIFGRSTAMLADGVHSLTDFVTDVIVIVFMGLSHRKANSKYSYGHGKYETFATMIVA
ncbi:MAG: cation transporter, partial [Muribaculaceae bacterium]|nr:cation transporter [Muribaculaceae bacterium]